MNAFRFLHTADLHLGTPFSGLAKQLPQEWLRRVQAASYKAFDRIVDIALEERVDFVTVAGDLFDSTRVPMAVQFELARGFERLRGADIRVFVSHGNHDPSTPTMRQPRSPSSFTCLPCGFPGYTTAGLCGRNTAGL